MSTIRNNPLSHIPPVTKNLLIINVLIWLAGQAAFNFGFNFWEHFSFYDFESSQFKPWQLVSYMFMHSKIGITHVLFNMVGLYFIGSILERSWGANYYLFFYITCGLGAALIHGFSDDLLALFGMAHSAGMASPMVGASGALYGLLVAFGLMHPNQSLYLMFIPIPIKAKYFVLGLVAMDLFMGLSGSNYLNFAHFAHLGGALFGFILMMYLRIANRP